MMFFKKKIYLIIVLLLITGCTSYTQISSIERMVKHKLFNDKEIIYLEKFDKKTNKWFEAQCNNFNVIDNSYSKIIEDCINNIEFTGVSKIKMEGLLSKNNNNNNQNSNSNDSDEEEDSFEEEEEEDSFEEEEEDDEDDEDEFEQ